MQEKKYLKWYNKVGYGSGDIAGNVVYAFLTSFVIPVLDGLHSISRRWVSLISSAHLNAKAFLGNFAVLPRESPYAISS